MRNDELEAEVKRLRGKLDEIREIMRWINSGPHDVSSVGYNLDRIEQIVEGYDE